MTTFHPQIDLSRCWTPLMVEMLLALGSVVRRGNYLFRAEIPNINMPAQQHALAYFKSKGLLGDEGELTEKGEKVREELLFQAAQLTEAL